MATTTATLTLSSADLTGDALSLSTTATLTKAGTVTGLNQTTGVARKTTSATSVEVSPVFLFFKVTSPFSVLAPVHSML